MHPSASPLLLALAGLALAGCEFMAYDVFANQARGAVDGGPDAGTADAGFPTTGPCAANGGCSADATCTVAGDSRTCACHDGFDGDGVTCTDVNECATGDAHCHVNATCENSPGSFNCACKPGYAGNGTTCADVDECATNNGGCPTGTRCSNTDGGRTCGDCEAGFAPVGDTCLDVDECRVDNGNCSPNAVCENTPGARTCTCKSGFTGDGVTCASCGACTLAAWRKTAKAPGRPAPASTFALGDRLVRVGGDESQWSDGTELHVATINADGTLGEFGKHIRELTTPHKNPCLARDAERVWVAGSEANTDVEVLAVANNSIGEWVTTTALPAARYTSQCAVIRGAVYVFGGMLYPSGAPAPTLRGVIGAGGTIAAWDPLGHEGGARVEGAGAVVGDRFYAIGGSASTGALLSSVSIATVQADGSVVWTEGRSLPQARRYLGATVHGDRIYVAEADNGSWGSGEILTSVVAADGTLGPWEFETKPPTDLLGGIPELVNANGRIYRLSPARDTYFTEAR